MEDETYEPKEITCSGGIVINFSAVFNNTEDKDDE